MFRSPDKPSSVQIYGLLLRHWLKQRKALRNDLRGFKQPSSAPSAMTKNVNTSSGTTFLTWTAIDGKRQP